MVLFVPCSTKVHHKTSIGILIHLDTEFKTALGTIGGWFISGTQELNNVLGSVAVPRYLKADKEMHCF